LQADGPDSLYRTNGARDARHERDRERYRRHPQIERRRCDNVPKQHRRDRSARHCRGGYADAASDDNERRDLQ
jgi:hypothetical protein